LSEKASFTYLPAKIILLPDTYIFPKCTKNRDK